MKLLIESERLGDYLAETEEVDFGHPSVQQTASSLFPQGLSRRETVRIAFEFVRDRISHSWDIQSSRMTRTASETLKYREGICYAKSNLLAALLRHQGIPAGFCYQKLTLGDTPDTGYCIHALNGVYLADEGKWIRLDARGNKEGVEAAFDPKEERLAFPVRPRFAEIDYPTVYVRPNPKTMEALRSHSDCLDLYRNHLPPDL